MSTKKTPGRRSQKPTEAIFSPTRITRLEEKTKLQHLNNRLEQYILKQRERDASQGVLEKELAALRDLHEQEMKNARAVWEEQVSFATAVVFVASMPNPPYRCRCMNPDPEASHRA